MDETDSKLATLGQAIDSARESLQDPGVRRALADPARTVRAATILLKLMGFAFAVQSALLPTHQPVPPEPEPRLAPEPGTSARH